MATPDNLLNFGTAYGNLLGLTPEADFMSGFTPEQQTLLNEIKQRQPPVNPFQSIFDKKDANIQAQQDLLKQYQDLSQQRTRSAFVNPDAGQKGFLDALKDPTEAQRNAFIAFGLGLASSTGDISQRLGTALGQGVGALQKTRAQDRARELQALQFQGQQLGLERQALTEQFDYAKFIETQQRERRKEERDRFEKDRDYNLRLREAQEGPEFLQLQDQVLDLEAEIRQVEGNPNLSQDIKDRNIQSLQTRINQINTKLAPSGFTVETTPGGLTRIIQGKRTSTPQADSGEPLGKVSIESQLDNLTELTNQAQTGQLATSIIYDRIAFEESIGGREYTLGLGDAARFFEKQKPGERGQAVASYLDKREKLTTKQVLPIIRNYAPVTDTDLQELKLYKGFSFELTPENLLLDYEGRLLPEEADLIYRKNLNVKLDDPKFGPDKAAINKIAYLDANYRQGLTQIPLNSNIYDANQRKERLNNIIRGYPTEGESLPLRGQGFLVLRNRVVSPEFVSNLAASMGTDYQSFVEKFNVRDF